MKKSYILLFVALAFFAALLFDLKSNSSFAKFLGSTKNISSIKKMDFEKVYTSIKNKCKSEDFNCISSILINITKKYGPASAYKIFLALKKDGIAGPALYEHELGHIVGDTAAKTFGVNKDTFLLCPTEAFNYGCQHGFFIYAFSRNILGLKGALKICNDIGNSHNSVRSVLNCYHGIGHGLMTSTNDNIEKSINECIKLPKTVYQDYCLDGVFMQAENDHADTGTKYSETNPLAPCDNFPPRYSAMCFLEHSLYLEKFFNNDLAKAQQVCKDLKDEDPRIYCAFSFGHLFSEEPWLLERTRLKGGEASVNVSMNNCKFYEGELRYQCYFGAMGNMVNNDFPDIKKRLLPFCSRTDEMFKYSCYYYVITQIREQTVDVLMRFRLCSELPGKYWPACYRFDVFSKRGAFVFFNYLLQTTFLRNLMPIMLIGLIN